MAPIQEHARPGFDWTPRLAFSRPSRARRPTVIKGKPDASPLYQRLISTDEEEIMPPPETHKALKPEQIAKVRQWIEQGAPWQPHWSLIAPVKAPLPAVKNKSWVKTPVDRFVLAKLEAVGLTPGQGGRCQCLDPPGVAGHHRDCLHRQRWWRVTCRRVARRSVTRSSPRWWMS